MPYAISNQSFALIEICESDMTVTQTLMIREGEVCTISLNNTLMVNSEGRIIIETDALLSISDKVEIEGIIENHGEIYITGWGVQNEGRIINNGTINNYGSIQNDRGGFDNFSEINNYHEIINNWKFNNNKILNNNGTIKNIPSGTIINRDILQNDGRIENSHQLENNKTIWNGAGIIENKVNGIIINNIYGNIHHDGGGNITNYGQIKNSNGIMNGGGLIENKITGTIENNNELSKIWNGGEGTIINHGHVLNNLGIITNESIFDHYGMFTNGDKIINNGIFTVYCGIMDDAGEFEGISIIDKCPSSSTCFDNDERIVKVNDWYNNGLTHLKNPDRTTDINALDCFENFLSLANLQHEKFDDAWYNIGVIQKRQGSCEHAIQSFNQYLLLRQDNDNLESVIDNLIEINDSGNCAGSIVPPLPPTEFKGTIVSVDKIDLTWNLPKFDGGSPIIGYKIEVSRDSGSFAPLIENTKTHETMYSHNNVIITSEYSYKISAINVVGSSPLSEMTVEPFRIEPIEPIFIVADESFSFTVNTHPILNDVIFSLKNEPIGASIDSRYGVFTWTPTKLQITESPHKFEVITELGITKSSQFVEFTVESSNVVRPIVFPYNVDVFSNNFVDISLEGNDVDDDPLTFETFQNPKHGKLSEIISVDNDSAIVIYTPDSDFFGLDSFSYYAKNENVSSTPAIVTIDVLSNCEKPPIAVIDSDIIVNEGENVILDGTQSKPINSNNTLDYTWNQKTDTQLEISNFNHDILEFVAPQVKHDTNLLFELTVTEIHCSSQSTVNVQILDTNVNPKAIIKSENTIYYPGDKVILDGSGSYDSDGDNITYFWIQNGNELFFNSSTNPELEFIIPQLDMELSTTIELIVNDGELEDRSTVELMIFPIPIANAGTSQTIEERREITLDGSNSIGSKTLTYKWEQIRGTIPIQFDVHSVNPVFIAPLVVDTEIYEFKLFVNDGNRDSLHDSVTITVTPNPWDWILDPLTWTIIGVFTATIIGIVGFKTMKRH